MSAPPKVGIDGRGRLVAMNVYPWHEAVKDLPGSRYAEAGRTAWSMPATPALAAALLTILAGTGAAVSPRVRALATEELSRAQVRAAAADESAPLPKLPWHDWLKTDPWRHQKRGIAFLRETSAAAIGAGMGTGKSLMVVGAANALQVRKLLIVAPAKAAGVWPREFRLHSACEWHVENGNRRGRGGALRRLGLDERWRVMVETLTTCACGKPHAVVVGYEAMAKAPLARADMLSLGIEMVVYDECLPAGTLIDTPDGPRPIESLRIGDLVMGVDHQTGEVVPTPVRYTFTSETSDPLCEVDGVAMTANHPVWTDRGYVRADEVRPGDTVCRIEGGSDARGNDRLRMVYEGVSEESQTEHSATEILRQGVFRALAHVAAGVRRSTSGEAQHATVAQSGCGKDEPTTESAGCCRETESASPWCVQSFPRPGGASTRCRDEPYSGMEGSQRRQRNGGDAGTTTTVTFAGLADGSSCTDGAAGAVANSLQAGRSVAGGHGGDRVRWPITPDETGSGAGCAQGRVPRFARLDSAAVPQRDDLTRDQDGAGRRRVFNIETGTGNYVASGLLVHNCHRLKKAGGAASLTAFSWVNQIPRRAALSGTMLPQTPADVYGTYRAVDPGIFGTNEAYFLAEWIVMGKTRDGRAFPKDVHKAKRGEFSQKFHSILYLPTVDLKLPPVINSIRSVELEPAARKVYDSIRDTGIAEITEAIIAAGGNPTPAGDERTVAPKNAGVELTRLAQITGGATIDDEGNVAVISQAKRTALADLLEEVHCTTGGQDGRSRPEPVVVFCRFKPDLAAVREVAAKAKLRYREVSGSRKDGLDDDSKMHPDCDVLGVQIASGGEAIDFTRAHVVVWYSIGWELWRFQQAQKRVTRPGQTRPTLNYYLVVEDSIDGIIYASLAKKENVIDAVVSAYLRHGGGAEPSTESLPMMPTDADAEMVGAPVGVPDWLLSADEPTRPPVKDDTEALALALAGFAGL